MNFTFGLQLFGGSSSTTNTSTYTPSEYELELQKQQSDYSKAVAPNALWLNNKARDLLQDSLGTVQVDYNNLNNTAQDQINAAHQGYQSLANGELPSAYTKNMTDAIQSGVQSTFGNLLNSAANRGVLNSSVTESGLNDISKNVADTMAQQYQNNINTVGNMYGRMENGATSGITTAAAAQEAAQTPATNLWNASLGLNGSTTGALAAAAGKGTTTQTQTTSGGSGFFGNLLGGVLGGAATGYAQGAASGIFCFPAGTKIKMADGGKKSIEQVHTGDSVMTGSGTPGKVVKTMDPHYSDVYSIIATDGHTTCTLTQPFMQTDGTYVAVDDMLIGTDLKGVGKVHSIMYSGALKVYDMQVDGDNSYIADGFVAQGGSSSVWGCE